VTQYSSVHLRKSICVGMLHALMESSAMIVRLMFCMLRRRIMQLFTFVVLQKTLNHCHSMHVWGNWENNHYVIEPFNCLQICKFTIVNTNNFMSKLTQT
jgi:hypothetical protein